MHLRNGNILILLALGWLAPQLAAAQCGFTISNPSPCTGESVTVSVDAPDGGVDYTWDLDADGATDLSGSSFDYTFPDVSQETEFPITLYVDGDSCSTQLATVFPTPDASIGVPPGIVLLNGNEIKACNGSASFELEIFNASGTMASNAGYTINWGDGSPPETYDNTTFSNTSTISHQYNGLGYFTLFVTATGLNGCVYTENYTFYNGGNPSVGLVIPGNTVGLCAPAILDFPITNTEGNPPGTEYRVFVNGEEVAYYTQDSLPDVFTYTFLESSCGATTSTGNYENAFDIRMVASNPCNSSTATIEPIEVSEPPEPFFEVTPPAFSCEGATFTFSNATEGITEVIAGNPSECIEVLNPNWTITGLAGEDWVVVDGNLFGGDEVTIEFLEPGAYTIEMTVISFACGPFTFSQTINIYEPPAIDGDMPISLTPAGGGDGCAPLDFTLSGAVAGADLTLDWQINPPDGWAWLDSTAAPTVRFLEGGEYSIALTATNPCAAVSWDTVFTVPGPPGLQLAPLPDFCESATLNFDSTQLTVTNNGSPVTQYNWSFPGASTESDTSAFPQQIDYDAPGTYTVTLTAANACGEQTVQDSFTVQTAATLDLPPAAAFCELDEAITLQASPSGGSWLGPGVENADQFSPALAGPGAHTLTYSYGVGVCFVEGSVTFTVAPAPTVAAAPVDPLCSNAPPLPLSAQPGGGQWMGEGLDGNSFAPAQAGAGAFTLTYTYVDPDNGCAASDDIEVTVLPAPELAASDTSYCNTPGAVLLPVADPPGGQWSGPGVDAANATFEPFAAGGAGSYELTYALTAANGCSASTTVQVGVIDPASVEAGPDLTLCYTDPVLDLNAAANPPGGSWLLDGEPLTAPQIEPAALGGGNYQLSYQVGSGNCAVEDALALEIIELAVVAGPDEEYCIDEGIIELTGAAPADGQWTGSGISGDGFDPEAAGAGVHELRYTITDPATGCQQADQRLIEVHPLPVPEFATPQVGCIGEVIAFDNQSTGAVAYDWDFGDGNVSVAEDAEHQYAAAGDFEVTLSARSAAGCTAATTRPLLIAPPPAAAFTPDTDQACGELNLTLTNESSGYDPAFNWSFGNGQTATGAQPPGSIYYPAGYNDTIYVIRLEVNDLCGTDIYRDTVEVRAFPLVDFGFTVDTGCAPLNVTFSNRSSGSPESWFWDFGNGQTATDSLPPPQLFDADTAAVTYPITLIAANACGADTVVRPLTVEPEIVQAFTNLSNTQGCAPFTVTATSFSTPGTMVSWRFSDGNTMNGPQVTHTFGEAGAYEITQHIANSCAEDSITVSVEVLPAPEISFSVSPNRCTGQEIQFTNTSGELAGNHWSFGQGDTSALTNPVFLFPDTGAYTVTLTGFAPGTGCPASASRLITIDPAPRPVLTFDRTEGCTPLQVVFGNESIGGDYYQWTFGDGNGSVEANPTHVYQAPGHYPVTLRVQDTRGCFSDTTYNDIFAFPVPEAAFRPEPSTACGLPAAVTFYNESTGAEGYYWDLGDGLTSNSQEPLQTYQTAGERTARLVAVNTYGCRDSTTRTFRLVDQPVAEFDLDSLNGCTPLRVQFHNYSAGDQFYWDFGDGNTAEGPAPAHDYTEPGRYDVRLVAAFADQCFDTLTLPGLVEAWPSPHANFSWEEEDPNRPTGTLQFINLSENADRFSWSFGDGATSEAFAPRHRYQENGLWQLRLVAANEYGCVDDTVGQIEPGFIRGLFVPSAFAPDFGAGEVQYFAPEGIGLKEYHLQIFSTYGQLLWETTELRDGRPIRGWDGTHNGNALPQDVYVWKIRAVFEDGAEWPGEPGKDGTPRRMGSVTLLR